MRTFALIFAFLYVYAFLSVTSNASEIPIKVAIAEKSSDITTNTLFTYEKYLGRLDPIDPNSVTYAIKEYNRLFDQRGIMSDKGFIAFRSYFGKVLESQNQMMDADTSNPLKIAVKSLDKTKLESGRGYFENGGKIKDKDKVLGDLFRNGMDFFISEGDIYIESRSSFEYESFSKKVSPAVSDYLQLRRKELLEGFQDDADLLITFSQVANRVGKWEEYIMRHQNSIMIEEAKYYYNMYLGTLLFGLDNSRVFDENNNIDKGILDVYKKYISSHRDTQSGHLIMEYLKILGKDNYKWNDNIKIFIKKNNIEVLSGVQPPTR